MIASSKNSSRISLLTDENGSAVALLVLALMVAGGITMFTYIARPVQTQDVVKNSRIVDARDALAYQITHYSNLEATFRQSLVSGGATNQTLQDCVLGNATSPCIAKNSNNVAISYPVALYYPVTTTGAAPQIFAGPATVNSTPGQPALYDIKGNLCTAANGNNCPFEVSASFTPTCAGGAASCLNAESIIVNYFIKSTATASAQKSFAFLRPVEKSTTPILTTKILPHLEGSWLNNQVTKISTAASADASSGTGTLSSADFSTQIATTISAAGITDPATITAMTLAIEKAIDNSMVIQYGKVDQAISTIVTAGITDPFIAVAIIDGFIFDPVVANVLANVIQTVGITDRDIAYAVCVNIITDIPKVTAINSAVMTAMQDPIWATVLSESRSPGWEFIKSGYTDPAKIVAVLNTIKTAGITETVDIVAIIQAGVTDPVLAWQIANNTVPEPTPAFVTPSPSPSSNPVQIGLIETCSGQEECPDTAY